MDQHNPLVLALAFALALIMLGEASVVASPATPRDSDYVLELEPFATHAGSKAMDLKHAGDDTGRVFVSTQSGQVFAYDRDGQPLGIFLDVAKARPDFTTTPKVPFRGLMYIAFHPDYAKPNAPGNGLFYTGHQVALSDQKPDYNTKDFGALGDSDVRFVIAQWRVDPDSPNRIDPASYRQVMLFHFYTYANNPHAIGQIAFNPYAKPGENDYGKLYLAVGDGHNGDYNQPTNLVRAQQTDNPFGKILRIDPLASEGKAYTIPDDNPFGNEVYATGLRDPQWFSFAKDLEGQTLLIACDIGALAIEEINLVRSGGNYGWDRFEGTSDFDLKRELVGDARPPVVQYGRWFQKEPGGESTNAGLVAIMGGLVVSDPADPSFQGQILFGDLPSGTLMHTNYHHALTVAKTARQSIPYVMSVRLGNKTGNFADVLGTDRGDIRFGMDQDNAVYLVSKQTNTIYKTRLIATGLPVKGKLTLNKPEGIDNRTGMLLTIGGVGLALLVILIVVVLGARRKAI